MVEILRELQQLKAQVADRDRELTELRASVSSDAPRTRQVRNTAPIANQQLKLELRSFSGERSEWHSWSRIHRAHTRSLGCDNAFSESSDRDIKVGRIDFDASGFSNETIEQAHMAWRSLISTCKGIAFDIVERAESPSKAWSALVEYYEPKCSGDMRRLRQEFSNLKMTAGEEPAKFIIKIDRLARELELHGEHTPESMIISTILNGLTKDYEEVKDMLDSEEAPSRKRLERVFLEDTLA